MSAATVSTFFALGAIIVIAVFVLLAAIGSTSRLWEPAASMWDRARDEIGPYALMLAWAMASLATVGSLYYSEIAHYPLCELCWYQRIGMCPVVVGSVVAVLIVTTVLLTMGGGESVGAVETGEVAVTGSALPTYDPAYLTRRSTLPSAFRRRRCWVSTSTSRRSPSQPTGERR